MTMFNFEEVRPRLLDFHLNPPKSHPPIPPEIYADLDSYDQWLVSKVYEDPTRMAFCCDENGYIIDEELWCAWEEPGMAGDVFARNWSEECLDWTFVISGGCWDAFHFLN